MLAKNLNYDIGDIIHTFDYDKLCVIDKIMNKDQTKNKFIVKSLKNNDWFIFNPYLNHFHKKSPNLIKSGLSLV